ncbi:NRPS [Arachnomyces sp. PD_36]|nr:NRPS [Arachnomyces sp. PD_36]
MSLPENMKMGSPDGLLQGDMDDCLDSRSSLSTAGDEGPHTITSAINDLNYSENDLSQSPLADHGPISENDRKQISSWNGDPPTEPLDCTIQTVIRQQCMIQPDDQAICAWDVTLSYRELDRLSSKVHALLSNHKVGPGMIVPLLFEKSGWAVVSLLGVLKAGAAFVLLEPSYPTDRLRTVCQDISANIIISSRENHSASSSLVDEVVVIGENIANLELCPPKSQWVDPRSAAYIAYTSGSTGAPKGVVIEHCSFCSNLLASARALGLGNTSRALQFSSYAFDISIHENLTPLMLGACVCIPSESQRMNSLKNVINELRADWLELTPSVARLLSPDELPTVQTVVLGGESMSPKDIETWGSKVRLICAYGPAECTVVSTIQPEVNLESDSRNIGRPFGGTCWVVEQDNDQRLVRIGDIGELVIGGPIVGQEYLNKPEQTARVFIQDPVWAQQFPRIARNQRFYKTGDLAKQNADGTFSFMGRKDTQVKIRGQRVELGEIEYHAQKRFPNVLAAAELVATAGRKESSSLVLFIGSKTHDQGVSDDVVDPTGTIICHPDKQFQDMALELRVALSKALPGHMIPTAYFPLIEMPLTLTGKLDRKTLRAAVSQLSENQLRIYRFTMPQIQEEKTRQCTNKRLEYTNNIEDILRGLFAKALSLDIAKVGSDDSFFQLGGDSITAISLAGEAEEEYGLRLTVEMVFKYPTISELSQRGLDTTMPITAHQIAPMSLLDPGEVESNVQLAMELCQISRDQIEDIYPCTPLQEGFMMWTARKPGYFQARLLFRLSLGVDMSRFKQAWGTVWKANPILRTRIIQTGSVGGALQVVVKEEMRWSIQNDVDEDINMSFGTPLAQCAVDSLACQDTDASRFFFITIHHAVFDEWSFAQVLRMVNEAYEGQAIETCQFTPFIDYLSRRDMDATMKFWGEQFRGLQAAVFPSKASVGYIPEKIISVARRITLPHTEGSTEHTLSTALRLAWALVIAEKTNSLDVVFGVTVTGRTAPLAGIRKSSGPTIASFPFRTLLGTDLRVENALKRMQDHATSLIPFEQTGIKQIRSGGKESAMACDFQSLFIVQSSKRQKPSSPLVEPIEFSQQEVNSSTHILSIICEPDMTTVSVKAAFDETILSQRQVQLMLNRLEVLLVKILENPQRVLGDLIRCRANGAIHRNPNQPPEESKQDPLVDVEQITRAYLPGFNVVAERITPKRMTSPRLVLFIVCQDEHPNRITSKPRQDEQWSIFTRPGNDVKDQMRRLMDYLRRCIPSSSVPLACIPVKYLPVSADGKLDRVYLREAASQLVWQDLQSLVEPTHEKDQVSYLESRLQSIIARILHLEPDNVGTNDDFFTLGGDSISAMQVVAHCQKENMAVSALDIFGAKTVALIASKVRSKMPLSQPRLPGPEGSEEGTLVPLSPQQQAFLSADGKEFDHKLNQVRFVQVTRSLSLNDLKQAIEAVVERHGMLRARFRESNSIWTQKVTPTVKGSYSLNEHHVSSRERLEEAVFECQHSLNFESGPAIAASLIGFEGNGKFLVIAAHPLVVDAASWNIIFNDLEGWFVNPTPGGSEPFDSKGFSNLHKQALPELSETSPPKILPQKFPSEYHYWEMAECHSKVPEAFISSVVDIEPSDTAAVLGRANSIFNSEPSDIILAALLHSFAKTFEDRTLPSMFCDTRGREVWDTSIDLSNNVGCFETSWPCEIDDNWREVGVVELVRRVKDVRRRYIRSQWSNSTPGLAKNSENKRAVLSDARAHLVFRSSGLHQIPQQPGSLFTEPPKPLKGITDIANIKRPQHRPFEIFAFIQDERLALDFSHQKGIRHGESIHKWSLQCQEVLEQVAQLLVGMRPGLTLSDIPLLPVEYSNIGSFEAKTMRVLNLDSMSEIEDAYPCTHTHRGLLFQHIHDNSHKQSHTIWEVKPRSEDGSIDVPRLREAWVSLVNRHPALRTVLIDSEFEEQQMNHIVRKKCFTDVQIITCEDTDALSILQKRRLPKAGKIILPHNLTLCQTHNGRVFCKLEGSHAFLDATSVLIILREFGLAYSSKLPSSPASPYRSWVAYLRGSCNQRSMDYWKNRIQKVEPCIFPKLHNNADITPARLGSARIRLGDTADLRHFCGTNGVTMTNIFQIAWALLLRKYTGCDDPCFGSLVTGRNSPMPQIHEIVGPFFNVLPCHLRLEKSMCLLDTLHQNQREIRDRILNENCSLSDVLRAASQSHQPLFNTCVSVEQQLSNGDDFRESEVYFKGVETHEETEYDLVVTFSTSQTNIEVCLSYWSSVAAENQAMEVLEALKEIVFQILDNPHTLVPMVRFSIQS